MGSSLTAERPWARNKAQKPPQEPENFWALTLALQMQKHHKNTLQKYASPPNLAFTPFLATKNKTEMWSSLLHTYRLLACSEERMLLTESPETEQHHQNQSGSHRRKVLGDSVHCLDSFTCYPTPRHTDPGEQNMAKWKRKQLGIPQHNPSMPKPVRWKKILN